MKLLLWVLPALLCANSCRADRFLNLDFEVRAYGSDALMTWQTGGDGYTVALDSATKYSGNYSLCMAGAGKTENNYAMCSAVFPLAVVKGKKVQLKAFIKTEQLASGNGALWICVNGEKGMLSLKNLNDGPTGTTGWKEYSIDVDVSEQAEVVSFGCAMTGKGKAWFDDLQVYIDGVKYDDNANKPYEPTAKELNWLRSKLIPVRTNDMNSDDKDLEPLKNLTKNAKIVALGEETHGASDIFKMKDRLIKYLVEKEGFTVFALEANMPEAFRLNEYIINGKGDAKELIKGIYYWAWDTEDMLALVEWMKSYNESHTKKVSFAGFDMQYYKVAMEEVMKVCGQYGDAAILQSLAKLKSDFDTFKYQRKFPKEQKEFVKREWAALDEFAEMNVTDKKERDWLIQNIRIMGQDYDDTSTYTRDYFMAQNLLWIKAHDSDAKIIVWAHNIHIQKTDSAMGYYLSKTLKSDYLPIGFTFHEGTYTGWENRALASHTATASYPGTFEYYFHKAGVPMFLIDLRSIPAKSAESSWLTGELDFRQVGKTVQQREFRPAKISKEFDMMVFIDKTGSSVVMHEHAKNE